jgi:hypothetical protein
MDLREARVAGTRRTVANCGEECQREQKIGPEKFTEQLGSEDRRRLSVFPCFLGVPCELF